MPWSFLPPFGSVRIPWTQLVHVQDDRQRLTRLDTRFHDFSERIVQTTDVSEIGERIAILPWSNARDAKVDLLDDRAVWRLLATMLHRRLLQSPSQLPDGVICAE